MKRLNGFTLIELLIVIGVMAIILTTVTGILISIVKAQQKVRILSEVKRNGDFVIGIIEENVRTGSNFSKVGNALKFVDKNGDTKFIGLRRPRVSCPSGSKPRQGYVYISATRNSTSNADKITNDGRSDGVNVKSFNVTVNSSDTTRVTIVIQIQKSPCETLFEGDNLETTFQTSVVPLR